MKTLGIIGFGNMGSCIGQRIKSKDFEIWVFDKDKTKTANLSGIQAAENNIDLVKKVDTIILAVKPQDFNTTLNEIKENAKDKLIISIAAGITTGYIEKYLVKVRVIRAMPNMPARIAKGMTCLCKGRFATDQDLDFAKQLFNNVGKTLILNEDMIDAATAVSGSGPGYFFYLIENKKLDVNNQDDVEKFKQALSASANNIGFSLQQAKILTEATTLGSIQLLKELNLSPSELIRQIASKGGTTEAALEILRKDVSLKDAVKAALKRTKELSKE